MNPVYIIATIIMALAALLPIMCLVKMQVNKCFQQSALATTADILYVEKRRGYKSTHYLIKLRYKTIDTGIEYTGQTVFGNKIKIGEQIPLWYKATDPAVFKTDEGKWLRWALLISLLFFGLICWLSVWLLSQTYTYQPGS